MLGGPASEAAGVAAVGSDPRQRSEQVPLSVPPAPDDQPPTRRTRPHRPPDPHEPTVRAVVRQAVRTVVVSYETVRRWCVKFGPAYAREVRRRLPRPGDKWHLDEVFIKINGEQKISSADC